MIIQTKIKKYGGSVVIPISHILLRVIDFNVGDDIMIQVDSNKLIITKIKKEDTNVNI